MRREFLEVPTILSWNQLWTGCYNTLYLPIECYESLAAVIGAYLCEVNQAKSRGYELFLRRQPANEVQNDMFGV